MKKTLFLFLSLFICSTIQAQYRANFEAAEKFKSSNIRKMLKSTRVNPQWFNNSDKFWYTYSTTEGKKFYLVDPNKKTKELLFDNKNFSAQLSELTAKPWNHKNLELKGLELEEDDQRLSFSVDKIDYYFDLESKQISKGDSTKEEDERLNWAYYSPDSTYIAYARNHNLYLMRTDDTDSTEIQLTTDGEANFSFAAGRNAQTETDTTKKFRPVARWFKDGSKIYSNRNDSRKVGDLWVIDEMADPRPTLQSYKYAMPGDLEVPQSHLSIFHVESKERIDVEIDKYLDQTINTYLPGETSEQLYFTRMNRTSDTLDVAMVNTTTGDVKTLFTEVNKPYFTWNWQQLAILEEGKELVYWSERNGWGQLYLYDGQTGSLKNKITNGGYFVTGRIQRIDTAARKVFYEGYGLDENQDPYHAKIYRSNLDGSGFKQISNEEGNHRTNFSESSKFFVDNYSASNIVPRSVLKDANGNLLIDLETADISLLKHAGWTKPEKFTVKADDGMTDLHGIMFKPFDFDSTRQYPIISYVYPGPQVESFGSSKEFTITGGYNTALAQLGFIVVSMGHRGGSPKRDKYYHTYGYQNLRDYALADDKRALEQLAERHQFIDLNQIGIFGHSGGGFMSSAALLSYPDFYKAAASSAGNHDNNVYNKWWSETHNGVKRNDKTTKDEDGNETTMTTWDAKIKTNPSLAKNLKGHLLLTHGTRDDNVHPANSMRLANELMKAGKRFDYMPIPGSRHGYGSKRDYYEQMMWYFFAEHLLGDYRNNVDIDLPNKN